MAAQTRLYETPIFVATWPFGKAACERAIEVAKFSSMLNAIEQGIWVTEADITNPSVGIGGIPNSEGQVELDACIMSGPDHNAGCVAGLQDIPHPISVARAVMESTPHVMLVGENARKFAIEHGFEPVDLLTEQQRVKWNQWRHDKTSLSVTGHHHDTIALLGLDGHGDLWGGCSTSGWGYKLPGRVGDSAIIGSGLYVDNHVGAAGATGLGENVMRHCGSFLVVELMRQGATPNEACRSAIERIAAADPRTVEELDINFIALNKQGQFGAAGTSLGFKYAVTTPDSSELFDAQNLTDKMIGPEGGNVR
jgi:L-asparaginase/N4-(beta-N-acetylglucosaminyl)-L-asparaginase